MSSSPTGPTRPILLAPLPLDVINFENVYRRLKSRFVVNLVETEPLTLRLLMSYIYMELLVKPEMLTGPTFGNAETVSFYLLHNVSTLNQCREVSCVTFVCKHFAS